MKVILVHNSPKVIKHWLESSIKYLNSDDNIVAIVCNKYEDNNNLYLYAKSKSDLFDHLLREIKEDEDCKIVFRINLFYDRTLNSDDYKKYSIIEIINDLFQLSVLERTRCFVYDEQLSLSKLVVSLFTPCSCFRNIDETFSN